MTRKLLIPIIIIVLIAAGFSYWYFFLHGPGSTLSTTSPQPSNGFSPFGRVTTPGSTPGATPTGAGNNGNQPLPTPTSAETIPPLRLLSNTPVGGYGTAIASSTTVVRWIDRGRGNVFEVIENQPMPTTVSNTIVPRFYESAWNKALTAFIGFMLPEGKDAPSTFYASLRPQAATSSATDANGQTIAPFVLKGTALPATVTSFAISPDGKKVFMFSVENGSGVGYIANIDGSSMTRLFNTPLTQVNVEWPEQNNIAVTTKGSISQPGFLYFVSPKTGVWTRILGPIAGLSARVSHDARYVVASSAGHNSDIQTAIYTVAKSSAMDAVVSTLADKCVWGNFFKEMVYCAVPSQPTAGAYPDDWYKGTVSFVDKIWQVNAATGEVHLVSSIVDQSDRVIDAFNLGLDAKDDYLFFMNKNDLSLWSLNLMASQ